MGKKVFVTGISGFLGSHIAEVLVKRGFFVIGLSRKDDIPERIKSPQIKIIKADLLNLDQYKEPLQQCSYIIHTAAIASFNSKDVSIYYRVNYEATKRLYDYCAQLPNIKRFIYISSRGTLGVEITPERSNENTIRPGTEYFDDYMKSKYMAEQHVLESTSSMDALVLSPTALWGSQDEKPTPIGAIVKNVLKGKVSTYVSGGINIIDVKDAAIAVANSLSMGHNKEIYIIGDKNITLFDFFKLVANAGNKKPPSIKVPYLVAYFGAMILSIITKVSGIPAMATPRKVYTLNHCHSYCDSSKAVKDLQLPQTSIEITAQTATKYFQE